MFLDRDGVINRAPIRNGVPNAPRTLAEFEILPGVPDALHRLREAGYLLSRRDEPARCTEGPNVAAGRRRDSYAATADAAGGRHPRLLSRRR